MSMGLKLIYDQTPRNGKDPVGQGAHLLPEMELDRVNIFVAFFGSEYHALGYLSLAEELFASGQNTSSIEYLKNYLDLENANTKKGGSGDGGLGT